MSYENDEDDSDLDGAALGALGALVSGGSMLDIVVGAGLGAVIDELDFFE